MGAPDAASLAWWGKNGTWGQGPLSTIHPLQSRARVRSLLSRILYRKCLAILGVGDARLLHRERSAGALDLRAEHLLLPLLRRASRFCIGDVIEHREPL